MGYRSDVSVVFYTRNEEATPLAAIKLWFDENYPRKTATEFWGAEIETGHDWVLVTYQNVKWYDGYEHVDAVREAIDKFEETFDANDADGTGSVELVEIGEQLDDIRETRSAYCDYRLNVRREIVLE
jgi:hypothetical protein